jgi:hypothetical protein
MSAREQEYRAEAADERQRAMEAEAVLSYWTAEFPGRTPEEVAGELEQAKDYERQRNHWRTEYKTLELAGDALVKQRDALTADNARLVAALDRIIAIQPRTAGGGCCYPMFDGEGNPMGEQPVDPIGVIKAMVHEAIDSLQDVAK